MFKRIFSKKSGFTLVEIVVAFAVFAVMAAAIMQIMAFISREKSDNSKFMDTLEAQEERLAAYYKDEFKTQDGEIVLNLKDVERPATIPYDMKAANGDEEGVGDGLVYFVTQVSEDDSGSGAGGSGGSGGGGSSDNKGGTQGQISAVDARITGSPKLDVIRIESIEKVSLGTGVRYYLQLYAGASDTMTEEEQNYAQFKLHFYNSESHDTTTPYTDSAEKTYKRVEYDKAVIVDAGYVNTDVSNPITESDLLSVVKGKNTTGSGSEYSPFFVSKTSDNTLRISSPYKSSDSAVKFERQSFRIYVDFAEDPDLSFASFGYNGASTGIYKPCPIWKETYNEDGTCKYEETGKTSNFIYGANMYKRNYD